MFVVDLEGEKSLEVDLAQFAWAEICKSFPTATLDSCVAGGFFFLLLASMA